MKFSLANRLRGPALLSGLMWVFLAWAHPDLQLQIDAVTEQLAGDANNTELLLRRGNLHRRHQDWQLARDDFQRVRQIEPDNADIDWLEGRMEVEAGRWQMGMDLLDRFLAENPDHAIALQNRAQAYLLTGRPLFAAKDYQAVISVSERPGPALFGACASAYIEAGNDHFSQAMEVIRSGLVRYPDEVLLTGLGTDIALARSETGTAQELIDSLPAPVLGLAQWQLRVSLLECQAGHGDGASNWFAEAVDHPAQERVTAGRLPEHWLQTLAETPSAENCARAALAMLQNR